MGRFSDFIKRLFNLPLSSNEKGAQIEFTKSFTGRTVYVPLWARYDIKKKLLERQIDYVSPEHDGDTAAFIFKNKKDASCVEQLLVDIEQEMTSVHEEQLFRTVEVPNDLLPRLRDLAGLYGYSLWDSQNADKTEVMFDKREDAEYIQELLVSGRLEKMSLEEFVFPSLKKEETILNNTLSSELKDKYIPSARKEITIASLDSVIAQCAQTAAEQNKYKPLRSWEHNDFQI